MADCLLCLIYKEKETLSCKYPRVAHSDPQKIIRMVKWADENFRHSTNETTEEKIRELLTAWKNDNRYS